MPFSFEFLHQVVDDHLIEVIPPRRLSPLVAFTSNKAVPHIQNGNIKGSTTQVKNKNRLLLILLCPSRRKGGGGGFVDNPKYFQSGDLSRILGRLTLTVVKVSRDSDNCLGHFFPR